MQEFKEIVEQYTPLKILDVPQARILMIGQIGAGKSSFFNTINSVLRGYITGQANSGSAEQSLTKVVSCWVFFTLFIKSTETAKCSDL